jgi:hypothetical protein
MPFDLPPCLLSEDSKPEVRLQPRNWRYRPQSIPAEEVTGLYKAVYKFQKIENE